MAFGLPLHAVQRATKAQAAHGRGLGGIAGRAVPLAVRGGGSGPAAAVAAVPAPRVRALRQRAFAAFAGRFCVTHHLHRTSGGVRRQSGEADGTTDAYRSARNRETRQFPHDFTVSYGVWRLGFSVLEDKKVSRGP